MGLVTDLKENYKRIIIPFIAFFLAYVFSIYLVDLLPDVFINPQIGVHPAAGLLFGPYGALGSSLANLITDIWGGYYPIEYIPGFFADFLYGYMTFRLWYLFSNRKNVSTPKLNSVYNLYKYFIIVLVSSVIYELFMVLCLSDMHGTVFNSITSISYILNGFVFAFIFGIISIVLMNLKDVKFTIPKKDNGKKYNPKILNGCLILAIALMIICLYAKTTLYNIITLIILVLFFVYLKKTIPYEIVQSKNYYSSIIEKIIFVFLVFSIIVMIAFAAATYNRYLNIQVDLPISLLLLTSMLLGLLVFQIPGIIVLHFIEKNFTTPISILISTTKEYLDEDDNSLNVLQRYADYMKDNDEVGELAKSFSLLINNIQKYTENLMKVTSEKERMETELNLANSIQQSILPGKSLKEDSFKINASMVPAREVGGDFYDFFKISDNKIAIVIGDASGKGIPAALFAIIASSLIKDHLMAGDSPRDMISAVNDRLAENNEESMFVTVWVGVIELDTGKLTFVNAGHNSPLICSNGKFDYLKDKHGLVLGAMGGIHYKENTLTLKDSDKIFIYTDGITEAHNYDDELFGDDRLLDLLNKRNYSVDEIISVIDASVDEFTGSRSQFDDMTMLVLEYYK